MFEIASVVFLTTASLPVNGEVVDASKLPPPATVEVDFVRDIKPILEDSCIKCHSGDKPKGGFRLTGRESALRGGYNGVAIIPGDSTNSMLVSYVARIVPDMEMPPEGRGPPLSADQVGLLRAWIDQGVKWDNEGLGAKVVAAATPTAVWTAVSGDDAKFRQMNWTTENWSGGFESFELSSRLSPDVQADVTGHALLNDYQIGASIEKTDLGFTRFGWKQYRKYYDDSGGFAPPLPVSDLDRDLYLDIGRAWVDFGLSAPRWPHVTLGYEYQYRDGTKSSLAWGAQTVDTNNIHNILPAYKDIAEHTHIIKLDANHDVAGLHLENNLRAEFYSLTDNSLNQAYLFDTAAPADEKEKVYYFQGANALTAERRFAPWLFAFGGYYYSTLDGHSSVNFATNSWNTVTPVSTDVNFFRESHIFSASTLLGPWKGFSLTAAAQSDWTRQSGSGNANADIWLPTEIYYAPYTFSSDLDRTTTEENIAIRYTGLPYTTVFAEGRLQQECFGLNEIDDSAPSEFLRRTDAASNSERFRLGLSSSPWRSVSWSTHYQIEHRCVDYNHPTDESPLGGEGYSAFITSRELNSLEFETKLTMRSNTRLNTTLSYKQIDTDYHTTTEAVPDFSYAGGRFPSSYNAHIYAAGAVFNPRSGLYLSTTFTYRDTRTKTVSGSGLPVVPYRGDVYGVVSSGSWALTKSTQLLMSYAYALADYSQSDAPDAVQFGTQYEQHAARIGLKRKLKSGAACGIEYAYQHYDEPSSGGHNNYSAHSVFLSLSFRLP